MRGQRGACWERPPCSWRARWAPRPRARPTPRWPSATTTGRRPSSTSTSASTSPGTGWAPTRCTRSPAISANDAGEDSDPNNAQPDHKLGFDLPRQLQPAGRLRVPLQAAPGGPRRGGRLRHRGQPARRPRPGPQAQRAAHPPHAQPGVPVHATIPERRHDAQPGARRPVDHRRRDLAREPRAPLHLRRLAAVARAHRLQLPALRRPGAGTSGPRRVGTSPSCRPPTSSTT